MLSAGVLDVDGHGRRLRRLLEAHGYRVDSVGSDGGNLVTIIAPPAAPHERISAGGLRSACKNRLYAHVFTLRRKLAQVCSRAGIQTTLRGYRLVLKAIAPR